MINLTDYIKEALDIDERNSEKLEKSSYVSRNFTNSSNIVQNSHESYMGYIAILSEQKLELHRYFFHTNKEINSWTVRFPLQKNNYT